MTLADTSVWVAHFRFGEPILARYLEEGSVLMHPWVCGELGCGNLARRESILSNLRALPKVEVAADSDVLTLIDQRRLWGRGLGWVDVHLLASALISRCRLWTLDKQLNTAAHDLELL